MKTEVDVRPVLDRIRGKLKNELPFSTFRTFRGKGKNEGMVLIRLRLENENKDLDIKIDVEKMLTDKHYFDNFYVDILNLLKASRQQEFEARRILS